MVTGYKDKDGVFHPIGKKGVSRKSRSVIRYANGAGSAQEATQQAKDFSAKIRDRYNKFKAEQVEEFNREISIRRKFGSKLINVYRTAQKQQIKSGRDLEKFIRERIPELPRDKKTNKFVTNILRDFKKSQQELEKKKKGKSEEEKKSLQREFEESLNESQILFAKQQAEQDREFERDEKKRKKDFEDKLKKAEKEAKEAEEARKKAEQDAEEAKKKAEDPNATEQEKQQAEQKAEQSEKTAEKEEKDQTDVGEEIAEELKKAQKEATAESFDFGFPEEII